MAKAPGKFIASIGPYKFYKTPAGVIVDDQGRPAPQKVIDTLTPIINAEDNVREDIEPVGEEETQRIKDSVTTPRATAPKKRRAKKKEEPKSLGGIIGRNILQAAFPGPYSAYEKYKESRDDSQREEQLKAKEQEKKDQENSQYKRDESELKTEINFTNVLMKDSSSLIRESMSGQKEVIELLDKINIQLDVIKTILAIKTAKDFFSGNRPGGPSAGPRSKGRGRLGLGLKTALAVGAGVATYELLQQNKDEETAPTSESNSAGERVAGTTPTGQSVNITTASQNTLEKQNIAIEAVSLTFKTDKLTFETDKLTIDAKNFPNKPAGGTTTPAAATGPDPWRWNPKPAS